MRRRAWIATMDCPARSTAPARSLERDSRTPPDGGVVVDGPAIGSPVFEAPCLFERLPERKNAMCIDDRGSLDRLSRASRKRVIGSSVLRRPALSPVQTETR